MASACQPDMLAFLQIADSALMDPNQDSQHTPSGCYQMPIVSYQG